MAASITASTPRSRRVKDSNARMRSSKASSTPSMTARSSSPLGVTVTLRVLRSSRGGATMSVEGTILAAG